MEETILQTSAKPQEPAPAIEAQEHDQQRQAELAAEKAEKAAAEAPAEPAKIAPPPAVAVPDLKMVGGKIVEIKGKTPAEYFAARLKPGAANEPGENGKEIPPAEWKACGQAQGVLFFEDVEIWDPTTKQLKVAKKGTERQAMGYLLAPTSDSQSLDCAEAKKHLAQALDWCAMHPGQIGMCEPSIDFLLLNHKEIVAEAEEAGFPIGRKFLTCKASINANQPAHALRWAVLKVESGVWAIFYV